VPSSAGSRNEPGSATVRSHLDAIVNRTWRRGVLASALGSALFWSAGAVADPDGGWYAGVGVGWNHAENMQLDELGGVVDYDFGVPMWSAALGWAFGSDWRVEVEASRQKNDVEIVSFSAPGSAPGAALDPAPENAFSATTLAINAVREFAVGEDFRPYLGAGIGLAWSELDITDGSIEAQIDPEPRDPLVDDKATGFAFQLIGGISLPLTRRLDLGLEYRYWQAPSVKLEEFTGTKLDAKHAVHSGWLQLRYRSGGAERAWPGASPRPAPRGFYLTTFAGAGFSVDVEIDPGQTNLDALDVGPVAAFGVGYALNRRWRFELETAFRKNEVELLDFGLRFGSREGSGRIRSTSLLASGTYQFWPGARTRPYLGIGAGLVWADYDVNVLDELFVDDEDQTYAVEVRLGADVSVSHRLTVSAEYRYWISGDMKMTGPDGGPVEAYQQTHSMMVGLRYALGSGR
jgi:opacity protein-like surface antigen